MTSSVNDLAIPDAVKDILRKLGISKLYPPQEAAIDAGALEGENLVLASPTASGKTLVAELCALKHVVEMDGKVLYLTPLRALAHEKYETFLRYSAVKKRSGKPVRVGISTGDYDSSSPWLRRYDIVITSVDYEEPIIIRENRVTKTVKIGDFIDKLMSTASNEVQVESDTEVLDVSNLNLEAVAFDPENLKLAFRRISKVVRHKVNAPLYRLKLETGREVTVTESHSIYTLDELNVIAKTVSKIRAGDFVLIPRRLPLSPSEDQEINLARELSGLRKAENLFVKNLPARFFESPAFKNLRARACDKENWRIRKELPLTKVAALGLDGELSASRTFFSYTGSRHKVPIKIPINKELLRLIGYYIAEGSMDEDDYRVSFSLDSTETGYIEDICGCAERLFHFRPCVDRRKNVTYIDICDKVAYLLFSKVLHLPRLAKKKRIPQIVFNVKQELQREFLKPLIRGDGTLEPRIDHFTSSRLLASDFLYLLLQNGTIGVVSHGKRRVRIPLDRSMRASCFDAYVSAWSDPSSINLCPELKEPSRHQRSHRVCMIPTAHIRGILRALCRESGDGSFVHFGKRTNKEKFEEWLASREKRVKLETLELLGKHGTLTSSRVSGILKIPWSTANTRLKSLLKDGLIKRWGGTGHYAYHISNRGLRLLEEIKLARKLFNSHLSFARVREIERVNPSGNHVYDVSVLGCENFVAGLGGVICHNTNEKCDSLLRHRADWIDEVTLVVADEVHLLTSADRGPTLEVTLARLRQLNPNTQILALSATIKNAEEVADWLGAEPITIDWRPVKLKEGVYLHHNKETIFKDGSASVVKGLDSDPSINVALNTVMKGRQALVFAGTRRRAVSLAKKAARSVYETLSKKERMKLEKTRDDILKSGERTKLSETLADLISRGAAFHHAGLAAPHRRVVEEAFREGLIKILSATPTLASGVNLPAKTVVMADYRRYIPGYGFYPISVLEYKQMVGRAGRPQYDDVGEAVMISRTDEEQDFLMEEFVCAEPERLWSKLAVESILRSHILATVATGFAHTESGLMKFLRSTFYAHQYGAGGMSETVSAILDFLIQEEMLRSRGEKLYATRFGQRVSELYIDPMSAVIIRDGLVTGAKTLTDFSFLHLISETPDLPRKPFPTKKDSDNIMIYIDEHADEFMTEIARAKSGDLLREVKAAMILKAWIDEEPEATILDRFRTEPGDLYYLASTANWLVYATREIAKLFGMKKMLPMLSILQDRVKYGVKEEIVAFARLSGIGRIRARMLFNSGFTTIKDLKRASIDRIAAIPLIGEKTAKSIKGQVGGLVEEKRWKAVKRGVEQKRISELTN